MTVLESHRDIFNIPAKRIIETILLPTNHNGHRESEITSRTFGPVTNLPHLMESEFSALADSLFSQVKEWTILKPVDLINQRKQSTLGALFNRDL